MPTNDATAALNVIGAALAKLHAAGVVCILCNDDEARAAVILIRGARVGDNPAGGRRLHMRADHD